MSSASADPVPFLDARVGVDYPARRIDVHLSAERGEIVGLVGPNGAGKTTVLRAIAGLRAVDQGRIAINGVVVDDAASDVFVAASRRRIGVVFQDYRLFPHLDALDNVAFGLRCHGADRRGARAAAMQWLERVELADHHHHRPAALSGGQAQRVALARALATSPDVLLLDEPLAAIDARSRARIIDDLGRFLSEFSGATILVSHDHDDVRALAHRAIALDRGVVAWRGPSAQLPRQDDDA